MDKKLSIIFLLYSLNLCAAKALGAEGAEESFLDTFSAQMAIRNKSCQSGRMLLADGLCGSRSEDYRVKSIRGPLRKDMKLSLQCARKELLCFLRKAKTAMSQKNLTVSVLAKELGLPEESYVMQTLKEAEKSGELIGWPIVEAKQQQKPQRKVASSRVSPLSFKSFTDVVVEEQPLLFEGADDQEEEKGRVDFCAPKKGKKAQIIDTVTALPLSAFSLSTLKKEALLFEGKDDGVIEDVLRASNVAISQLENIAEYLSLWCQHCFCFGKWSDLKELPQLSEDQCFRVANIERRLEAVETPLGWSQQQDNLSVLIRDLQEMRKQLFNKFMHKDLDEGLGRNIVLYGPGSVGGDPLAHSDQPEDLKVLLGHLRLFMESHSLTINQIWKVLHSSSQPLIGEDQKIAKYLTELSARNALKGTAKLAGIPEVSMELMESYANYMEKQILISLQLYGENLGWNSLKKYKISSSFQDALCQIEDIKNNDQTVQGFQSLIFLYTEVRRMVCAELSTQRMHAAWGTSGKGWVVSA